MNESTTPNPTPEQILVDEWIRQADRSRSMAGMDAIWFPDAKETLAVLRANGLLSEGEPSDDAVRDAVDHVRGAVEFQDAISPEAVRVLTDAVILARPLIQDPAVTALVAEAREWAKYDSTGASKIVIDLCAALTATGVAPQILALDPENVAGHMEDYYDRWSGPGEESPTFRDYADALCEAYTQGKLT